MRFRHSAAEGAEHHSRTQITRGLKGKRGKTACRRVAVPQPLCFDPVCLQSRRPARMMIEILRTTCYVVITCRERARIYRLSRFASFSVHSRSVPKANPSSGETTAFVRLLPCSFFSCRLVYVADDAVGKKKNYKETKEKMVRNGPAGCVFKRAHVRLRFLSQS